MSPTRKITVTTTAALLGCLSFAVAGAAQGVRQGYRSDAPSMRFAWQWSATPEQQHAVCEGFASLDSIEVLHCRGNELNFRVRPGQQVRLSELNAKIQAVVPEARITLRGTGVLGTFELEMRESFDPSQDGAFREAIASRRSVASVENPAPRHFKVTPRDGQMFVMGQLLQLYVRALHHRGRVQLQDIVEDVVFYGPES